LAVSIPVGFAIFVDIYSSGWDQVRNTYNTNLVKQVNNGLLLSIVTQRVPPLRHKRCHKNEKKNKTKTKQIQQSV
jgi:hypothetical protein